MLFVPLPVILSHAVLRLCRKTIACEYLRMKQIHLVYKNQFMTKHFLLFIYILITYLLQSFDMEYHILVTVVKNLEYNRRF